MGSQPVAADLGLTPGFKSIVFGLRNGKLYVVRHNNNGTWGAATGWPQQLPTHIYSRPAVGDVNGDDEPDIVVGYGSVETQGMAHGGLRAYGRDGSLLWEVQTDDVTPGPANGLRDPVMATPAIGDIDGDGSMEVVFGALDHQLYVVNGENGLSNNTAVWPKDMQDTVFSSPALHDMDGDGRLDIITGTDYFLNGGGRLRVLRYDGTELTGFPKSIDQAVSSPPTVGDIDGDGKPDIVHGTGAFFPGRLERVYAWRCDGSAVPGWPVAVSGQVYTSPTLVNLDADPALEVLVTADNSRSSTEFHLYAFNGDGSQIFSTTVRGFFGDSLSAREPMVADVLGDTALEILVATNAEVAVFTKAGVQLTENDGWPDDLTKVNFATQGSLSGVIATDLETDGSDDKIEVVTVSARNFDTQTITVVHAWNPVSRTSTPPWGMFRQDPARRGVAPGTGPCNGACGGPTAPLDFYTLTPCRLVDTRSAAGPRGGPVLASGTVRNFALTGICGVPATAKALSLNVTVTGGTGLGYVRFSPACQLPVTAIIDFNTGQTRANNSLLALGAGGILTAGATVSGAGTVHLILDVNGYFE
ncbi:MAG TPA: VCBS repeat-containing protein [Thermoanaerobaculia bacterium]|nr:VCBS repeat-containing protein [Thermoanaerobaculia bacterium]